MKFISIFTLLQIVLVSSSKLSTPTSPQKDVKSLKDTILKLAQDVSRGEKESVEQRKTMINLIEDLEKQNKLKSTLASPNLSGDWKLEYTTSKKLLGVGSITRSTGEIRQIINTENLSAVNIEKIKYFGTVNLTQKVLAKLSPMTDNKVEVRFQRFWFGRITFPSPRFIRGELEITYVDENFRLSRGDKGNLFVLTKNPKSNCK